MDLTAYFHGLISSIKYKGKTIPVYYIKPSEGVKGLRIIYSLVNDGTTAKTLAEEEKTANITYKVDIYSPDALANIEVCELIKNKLKGWTRGLNVDTYEDDTKLYHKTLTFRTNLDVKNKINYGGL